MKRLPQFNYDWLAVGIDELERELQKVIDTKHIYCEEDYQGLMMYLPEEIKRLKEIQKRLK